MPKPFQLLTEAKI